MGFITLETNIADVLAGLDTLKRKQVPYASARTLTSLAYDARDDARNRLSEYFTIRTKWVERGIQVGMQARKNDWPNQKASVGSRDEFMALHALGGTKKGRGGDMAVPDEARELVGRNNGTLPRSTWPSRIKGRRKAGNRNKFFVRKLKSGPSKGLEAVLRRDGDDAYPLQVIYVMKPSVKIDKKWNFESDAERFVRTNYATYFGRALARAIATQK